MKPKINLWNFLSNILVIVVKQMVIKVGSHLPCNPSNKVQREVHTFLTFWKSCNLLSTRFSFSYKFPLFFHDTDCVKKREERREKGEGKGNIKLSFVWLLGEEKKNEKVKKVESTQHNNFFIKNLTLKKGKGMCEMSIKRFRCI